MYRFDMDVLDWAWTNERTGHQPKYGFLQSISPAGNLGDETWQLPDGTVYQKYDYCLYFADSPMWGHYGHGFGVFFMPVSTESYAGGPLRQELAVHQDALILNYIGGGHFGGGGSATGRNGEKIHGPWFLYFNTGATNEAIIEDAKKVAAAEKAKWPYAWMKDEPLYPVQRTTVTGQLKLTHGRVAAHAYVILGQPDNPGRGGPGGGGFAGRGTPAGRGGPAAGAAGQSGAPESAQAGEAGAAARGRRGGGGGGGARGPVGVPDRASIVYNQSGDYIFAVQADAAGRFRLPAVRPGTYTLYAWQTQGPVTQSFARDGVEVKGNTLDLGTLDWDAPYHPNLVFQVGKADRMAGEFRFGSLPRTNQWTKQVPTDLTFTIGRSNEAQDWYYAQHSGTWNIVFDLAKVPSGNGYLTIPIAGGPGNVNVLVNGEKVGAIAKGDDASVRRAANRSGVYARFEFTFPTTLLRTGSNVVSLAMPPRGGRGGRGSAAAEGQAAPTGQQSGSPDSNGLMYDTVVLETD
jgi:hypothetical protein